MTKNEFINKAVGLPWVDRAQSWGSMDCWGLVVMYYRHVIGVELPDVHALDFGDGMKSAIDTGLFLASQEPVGDGVIFTAVDPSTGAPCHVGVCVDNRMVLHSNHGYGVRCDKLDVLKRAYGRLEYYAYTGRTGRAS